MNIYSIKILKEETNSKWPVIIFVYRLLTATFDVIPEEETGTRHASGFKIIIRRVGHDINMEELFQFLFKKLYDQQLPNV
ncbi:hypothetical protein RCL_jg13915.t1 [Rhizophagus clarus]|uniref:Uncharacterized protein n=1 Tax=Rhizophagus clarus TaxID=94130 RepID=A0A8H3QTT3_9GLOM|nr:hypothetical protein RCL_jg13915.t1 [Rhizophagus clarus]